MSTYQDIALYNGCTHVFTFKEDGGYSVYIGNDDKVGFKQAHFLRYNKARKYARETYPKLKFYRANH